MSIKKYKDIYQTKQISENFADLANSSVAPFNLPTFFAVEAGEQAQEQLLELLYGQFGDERFAKLLTAIKNGEISKEDIDKLRDEITAQMEELLGPLKVLAIDIPFLSDIENAVADWALGDEIEKLRESAASMELNESLFENVCEDI